MLPVPKLYRKIEFLINLNPIVKIKASIVKNVKQYNKLNLLDLISEY